jgi:hypothetical protein
MPQTQDLTNLATCIGSITTGGTIIAGDVPLTRVSDDNGDEIGTWYMNFEGSNGNIYKVILLDAVYRNDATQWCSNRNSVTNLPIYDDLSSSNVWESRMTATENTQLILDYCIAGSYTSSACTHCRSQSFTIDGVTYDGQLPNMIELVHIAKHYHEFDSLDSSSSTSTSTNFSTHHTFWSSNQYASDCWGLTYGGTIYDLNKSLTSFFSAPVLEIPLS